MSNNINTPRLRFPGFSGEWEEKKLGECFVMLANSTLSRSELNTTTGKALYVHYGDVLIKFGELLDLEKVSLPYITNDDFAKKACRSTLQNGDVIVADTAEDDTVGKCSEINGIGKMPVVSGLHTIPLRPTCFFANGFLGYYLNSPSYRGSLYTLMQGVKVTSISRTALQGTIIKYPPTLPEQQKIAECLMAMDQLIYAESAKVDALKEKKKGLMQRMFPQQGENAPRLRFPGFSGEWEEKKLGEVIVESRESSTTENEDTLLTSSIDGLYLNSEVFSHQRGCTTIGYRKIKKGMLVLSAQNLHLGNANVNMRFDSGLVSPAYKVYDIVGCLPQFLGHWVKREETKQFFFDATTQGAIECRRNVVWEQLYKQTLPIPSLPEQQKIAECLMAMDQLISAESAKVDALKEKKKGLMQQLFPQTL